MSLATRCPACGTVFRVVPDQLKVSEGWVRCGRCCEVFNAAQPLFELEADTTPQERPGAVVHHLPVRDDAGAGADAVPAQAQADAAPQSAELVPLGGREASLERATAEAPTAVAPAAEAPPPATEALSPAQEAPPPAVVAPPLVQEAFRPVDESSGSAEQAPAPAEETPPEPMAPAPEAPPTPEFIRRADRAERWRHPARRAVLGSVAVLLAALLAGQMVLHYRDTVAAAWPAARPALLAACQVLGCRVEAPRRIDSLHVDSSGLVRMPDSALYSLTLVVQNKASTPVRTPAIDLALTDMQGQTVVRRVFTAAELGQPAEQLPAGAELALQATLDLGERNVAGYTIELFYP